MSDAKDDLFGDDPEARKVLEEIDAHGRAIFRLICDYADEHELSDEFVSEMAFEAGVHLRMLAYVRETAKPSASGLKLDLDRCRRDLDDVFRDYKKAADEYVRATKEAIEDAEEGGAPN